MDNPVHTWAPHKAIVALAWLIAIGCLGATIFSALAQEPSGAVFLGIGAVFSGALAGYGSWVRPTLAANPQGVQVRTLSGTWRLDWDQVELRLKHTNRLGRRLSTVELENLENAERLFVFGWLELGEEPESVYQTLIAIRAHRLGST